MDMTRIAPLLIALAALAQPALAQQSKPADKAAALEAMLCKRPMVVGHRISPTTYRIVTKLGLLKTRYVSLPNVLADAPLVPELLQDDCVPEKLAAACLRWLGQPQAVEAVLPRFVELHETLRRDASARAADAVAELVAGPVAIAP